MVRTHLNTGDIDDDIKPLSIEDECKKKIAQPSWDCSSKMDRLYNLCEKTMELIGS